MNTGSDIKPILKWAGGKRQLLSDIVPLIPRDALYVEPFIGGGAVLFGTTPLRAVVSDANSELINVYEVVRDNADNLIDLLTEYEAKNSADFYYEIRALDREPDFSSKPKLQRAARMIYLNKTCYNGLWRVNSKGQNNVPYGKYKNPNIVNANSLRAVSTYLQEHVDIYCQDYAETLNGLPDNAFVYLDPPYQPISETSAYTSYTKTGFSYEEQVRLHSECVKLREQGIPFLQSNSDCEEIRSLYSDFEIKSVKATRAINSKGTGRGKIGEVLIIG